MPEPDLELASMPKPARPSSLRVLVRTPRSLVCEREARSLRVPSRSGQIGFRPRCEPAVVDIEPGLILLSPEWYIGTAGGLLHVDGRTAIVLSPIAVSGHDVDQVLQALQRVLEVPNEELEARGILGRLEQSIQNELRRERAGRAQPPERLS